MKDGSTKNILPFTIPAGDLLTYDLTFAPTYEKSYLDSVIITSNDPGTPIKFIKVTGEGILILDAPENVNITVLNDSIFIDWEPVSGATSYSVYSATNPEEIPANWNLEASGITATTWSESVLENMKFYYIKAIKN